MRLHAGVAGRCRLRAAGYYKRAGAHDLLASQVSVVE